jgi:hypothetical protein
MSPGVRIAILLVIACSLTLHAGEIAESENQARQQIAERGEVYFSFPSPGQLHLKNFLAGVSVDRVQNDSVFAYAGQRGFELFLQGGMPFRVLSPPGMVDFDLRMKGPEELGSKDLSADWDFYPTYEGYLQLMANFENEFPELCQVVSIGQSTMGRELLFARITSAGSQTDPVPRFMYTSTMHGDETAGFVLSLRLIHYLLNHYGKDEAITRLLRETEIWICPNENPDGTYRDDNSTISGATRGNIHGVDLNRNYPNPVMDPWNEMQAETASMVMFVDTMHFVLSANMHGGIELVNYPFDSWLSSQNRHADHQWWQFVMQEYVDTVHHYSPSGYMTGLGTGITHGGDWYVVYGSRQDYMNYYLSCREFTLELSNQKIPPPSVLPVLWENNYRSLLNYIRQSAYGLAGIVSDAINGGMLEAIVHIPGHDSNNSAVASMPGSGFFQRPLQQGVFDVMISANDYPGMLFPGLEIRNYETLWLDVRMGVLDTHPLVVDFEPAVAGGAAQKNLLVHNPGPQTVHTGIAAVAGDGVFGYGVPAKQQFFTLLSGESRLIPLSFTPAMPGEYQADLLFSLDGEPEAFVVVPLHGLALEEAALVHSESDAIDFGEIAIGSLSTRTIYLRNAGNLELLIDSAWIAGEAFSLGGTFPAVIPPGGSFEWQLSFRPAEEGLHESALSVKSNAFNTESLSVVIRGMGKQTATAVHDLPGSPVPVVYPNPFQGRAVLRLELPLAGIVTAGIYDLQGRLVSLPLEAILDAGLHELELFGGGEGLIPGMYILRVTTPQAAFRVNIVRIKSG